ncbi:hypothetical protein C461_00467 [Halorubrum aidingense JCM 13560]|uniref:Uncharacterized protein n=1 Tax=Halorubrum aidingense JCM 13560 TaxID=1230454 RepID=M0PKW6_9EURY|nr:hypothetical protein [Halorubrum aidingense]EMA70716.1 hypothetical protein C461_00467 [Halorubrum aidingense JCM 13560]
MGGFKEGTVNGWDTETDTEATESATADDDTDTSPSAERSADVDARPGDADAPDPAEDREATTEATSAAIPWILRRNSITDGRTQTVQLHLQERTLEVQRTQKIAIEDRLGESVRKADLREAALLVGLQRTDDVVGVLEEWGYAVGSTTPP